MQPANNNSEQNDGFHSDRDNSEKPNLTAKRKSEDRNEETSSYSIDRRNREQYEIEEMAGAVGTNLENQNEPKNERALRRKKMNAVHSKRKRDRQKIEIEVLRNQCSELSAQNLQLYHKNKKLDELILTAHEFDMHCFPDSSIEQSSLNSRKSQSLTHQSSDNVSLNVFDYGQFTAMPQVQVLSNEGINSNRASTLSANELQIGPSVQATENSTSFTSQLNIFLSAQSNLSKNDANINNTMPQVANPTNQPILQLHRMIAEQIPSAVHSSLQNRDVGMIQENLGSSNTDERKCSAIDLASNQLLSQGSTVDSTSFPLLFSTASGPIDFDGSMAVQNMNTSTTVPQQTQTKVIAMNQRLVSQQEQLFPQQQAIGYRNDQNPRNHDGPDGTQVNNLHQQTLINSLLQAISQRETGIDLQTLSSIHNFVQTTASLSPASQIGGDINHTSMENNSISQHLGSLLQLIAYFVQHSMRSQAEGDQHQQKEKNRFDTEK